MEDISIEEISINKPLVKKRGKAKYYDNYCSFNSLKKAEDALSGTFLNNKWVHKNTTDSLEGEKKWYYCKIKSCPVVCQLILNKDLLTRVSLLLSDNHHSHDDNQAVDSQPNEHRIAREFKVKIEELVSFGCKPGKIMIELRKAGLEVPKTTQLYNFIKYNRKDKLGSTTISLNDLKEWAATRMDIPDDEDTMFVGSFHYEATPIKKFRIFLTTKRLISFAKKVGVNFLIVFSFSLIGCFYF